MKIVVTCAVLVEGEEVGLVERPVGSVHQKHRQLLLVKTQTRPLGPGTKTV